MQLQCPGDPRVQAGKDHPAGTKPRTSNSRVEGRFDKRDFTCDPAADRYARAAGERAIHRFTAKENGLTLHVYWPCA
ncbi:hypothetical protein GCM10022229_16120 [Luteimonas lutimaris]|uniref:Uncharacterized protein n=1 Tax=Luteimonas lutimaris TaxID=698645 RepID=A0ABP7MH91_9GAMM